MRRAIEFEIRLAYHDRILKTLPESMQAKTALNRHLVLPTNIKIQVCSVPPLAAVFLIMSFKQTNITMPLKPRLSVEE
jgi:hypothetical protein